MISRAYNLIFIHVPKAAGTSVETALGLHPGSGATWGSQDHRTLRQLRLPARPGQLLAGPGNALELARTARTWTRRPRPAERPLSRAEYAAFLKFAVVRNPWARTWSWYRNVRADVWQQRRLGVRPDVSFPDFVAGQLGRDLLRPQLDWIVDWTGRIGVDRLSRFESLDADFAAVCASRGLVGLQLPHANPGPGDHDHRAAYDDRTRLLIADFYRREIDLFGYAFDDAPGALRPLVR